MKNPLKKLVPFLLAIAIIACGVWYVTVYDRDFAQDMLLSQARYFEKEGKHDTAAWLYNLAYAYAGNDVNVAIELAEQYKSSGNYTKAEYTLSNAIANGPSAELYIALCKTYVEQDKLIDAVSMLDNIADPAIKEEVNALRPAAPAASQASGYYTQYITVELTAESGTLLFSTDNEYPSINEDVYADPMDLPQGETTVYALTVAENGLVSPLAIYGYTIGGVIEQVHFADAAIEAEVRNLLALDEETDVYTDDLWTITVFTVPQEAQVYTDLTNMMYLTELNIPNGVSDQLSCISSLSQLQELFITGCNVDQQTMTTIASLPELQALTLVNCSLSDISPLANAHNLTYLDLSYNSIGDISSLSSLAGLRTLYLTNNALTDLSALSSLGNLELLNVSYNSLTSVAPICANLSLEHLNVSHNLLTSLGAVDNLPNLTVLNAGYNKLTDVSVLGNCAALEELDISNNTITDISALAPLMNLVKFDFSYNAVTALPDWSTAITLVTLDGSYNQITDLSPLARLSCLNILSMDYNPELSSVQELAYCPNLIEVNLFGTKVTDVEILTSQSVIVHYNPTSVEVVIDPEAGETTPEDAPE